MRFYFHTRMETTVFILDIYLSSLAYNSWEIFFPTKRYGMTDGRTDKVNHRVASLLKNINKVALYKLLIYNNQIT